MDLHPFREYALLKEKYKALDTERKSIKVKMDSLQDALIDVLISEGMSKVPIDVPDVGAILLYPHTTVWSRPKDGDMAGLVSALKNNGLGDVVKENVHRQTISALVRESQKEDGEPLPQDVLDHLDTYEEVQLAMKKQ